MPISNDDTVTTFARISSRLFADPRGPQRLGIIFQHAILESPDDRIRDIGFAAKGWRVGELFGRVPDDTQDLLPATALRIGPRSWLESGAHTRHPRYGL